METHKRCRAKDKAEAAKVAAAAARGFKKSKTYLELIMMKTYISRENKKVAF